MTGGTKIKGGTAMRRTVCPALRRAARAANDRANRIDRIACGAGLDSHATVVQLADHQAELAARRAGLRRVPDGRGLVKLVREK